MPFCPSCGTQIADGAVCPKCADGVQTAAAPATSGLSDNQAGALAYLLVPAIVFLVLEPYNKNRFIRFHSFQSLFVFAAILVVLIALGIVAMIPFIGLITIPVYFVLSLGSFILGIVLLLKAYQGQMFKLPVVGDMAEKQANAI